MKSTGVDPGPWSWTGRIGHRLFASSTSSAAVVCVPDANLVSLIAHLTSIMRLALTLGVALAAVAHSSAFHLPRTPRSPIVGRHGTRAPRRLVSAPRMGLMDDAANLPPQKVVDALANGGRFAASDVAAKTGSSIEEAKRALRDLAALLGEEAGLEVSSDGELVYKVRENATRGAVVVQQPLASVLRPPHLPALTTHQKTRAHPPPLSTHRPHVPW